MGFKWSAPMMTPRSFPLSFRWAPILAALIALVLLAGVSDLQAAAPRAEDGRPEKVFEEVWRTVRDHFYDREYSGLDWDEVAERYRPLVRRSRGGRPLHRLLNRMLAELGVSHAVVVEREVFRDHIRAEFRNRKVPRAGLSLVRLDEGYFVLSLLEGGPAEDAGIRRGDEVVSIDGTPVEASERLLPAGSDPGMPGPPVFLISAAGTDRIRIGLLRTPGEASEREFILIPRATNQIEAIRRSIRVVERGEDRLGVIHLRHLMSDPVARILENALAGDLADVDALVVDLRGRGGTTLVALRVLERFRDLAPPLVGVIDGHTRSAKEVVAYRIREEEIGILVGERTEGAVLAGQFFPLSDGSVLMLPTSDVDNLTDGVRLEGMGVKPHVWAEDRVRYANGEDPLLERALQVASALARGIALPKRAWY